MICLTEVVEGLRGGRRLLDPPAGQSAVLGDFMDTGLVTLYASQVLSSDRLKLLT